MEEFDEVPLVLNEHALPCALEAQGILGLCKVCGVGEEGVGAIQVYHSGALNVDSYDGFCLEGVGWAGCIVGTDPADGGEEVNSCKALGKVPVEGEELAVEEGLF